MCRGGGGTLISVGSDHFWGFKILNFNIYFWGGVEAGSKNEYFAGYENFVNIFGGNHKTGLVLGII